MTTKIAMMVHLYSTNHSGRKLPIKPGFRCIVLSDPEVNVGFSIMPMIDEDMAPGHSRIIDIQYLVEDGVKEAIRAKKVYLWDGRVIGEAIPM